MKKIAIAMSGGIDSSVSAFLLQKAGFDVIGIHAIFHKNYNKQSLKIARQTAKHLNIPFFVLNLQKEFKKEIINAFINDLKSGITPNPCVFCNERIKFGLLLREAEKQRATMLATGHYAKIKDKKLFKANDSLKDQSYFLWRLKQNQLKNILFPLSSLTKEKVKKIAKEIGFASSRSKESQDICFCPDFKEFVKKKIKLKSGDIIDAKNNILGKHEGLPLYTTGQRQGIKLSGGPYYVFKKDIKNNLLIVTKDLKEISSKILIAKNINWISGITPKFPLRARAQIRYGHKAQLATITKKNNSLKVEFDKLQLAITPGQSVVFFKNKQVLGGGIIQ
ncbi:MAG: tRNA 2-thiouridine(34) synthase MnmA [Candidatus Paceibacterota bacterium]|jgi:tRNA-specific 2-thiouridylase|nr:tRNA 2-thiouridine(34) synthase MnmA [Candidatus Paceibacterota bacterium]MDD5621042.1 tRNA 2-thiouridine(34) synthase MnmA [Candidatus Paceibacterota bacterium]